MVRGDACLANLCARSTSSDTQHTLLRKHLKDLHKVGRRVKLLGIDRALSRDECATWIAGALLWNNDVPKYVSGRREFFAEHRSVFERDSG